MLRSCIQLLISEMKLRVSDLYILLIKVSITDGKRLIFHNIGSLPCFHGGHLENYPKWWIGPKILSVNILILNQGGPMNNIIPLPEGP